MGHLRAYAASRGVVRLKLTTPSVNVGPLQFYRTNGFSVSSLFTVREASWGDLELDHWSGGMAGKLKSPGASTGPSLG